MLSLAECLKLITEIRKASLSQKYNPPPPPPTIVKFLRKVYKKVNALVAPAKEKGTESLIKK
jgi:hypothetical protein